jgi:hypothetical protein
MGERVNVLFLGLLQDPLSMAACRRITMRKLTEKDTEILMKLAPEARAPIHYRSILPPVSFHYAADEEDFEDRLQRLSEEDFSYLADRIMDGAECLLCISPESAKVFVEMLEKKLGGDKAEKIRELYKSSTGFEA